MTEFDSAKKSLSSAFVYTIRDTMKAFFEKQIPFSIIVRVDYTWEAIIPKSVIHYDKLDSAKMSSGTVRFQIKEVSLTNSYIRNEVLYLYTKLEEAQGLLELQIRLKDIDILFFGMDMHPSMRLINPVATETIEITHHDKLDMAIRSYSYFKSINHSIVLNKDKDALIYEKVITDKEL